MYWGFMVKQNRNKTLSEFEKAALAPLEHLFDCHDVCGDWYKQEVKTDEEKSNQHSITDAKRYIQSYTVS